MDPWSTSRACPGRLRPVASSGRVLAVAEWCHLCQLLAAEGHQVPRVGQPHASAGSFWGDLATL
eukprot:2608201-Alexandrium_andersonii.AAC.1